MLKRYNRTKSVTSFENKDIRKNVIFQINTTTHFFFQIASFYSVYFQHVIICQFLHPLLWNRYRRGMKPAARDDPKFNWNGLRIDRCRFQSLSQLRLYLTSVSMRDIKTLNLESPTINFWKLPLLFHQRTCGTQIWSSLVTYHQWGRVTFI